MRKTAFLFPGQGAQNVGMGRSFYEKYDAVFKSDRIHADCHVYNRMCDTARFTGKKDSVRSGGRAFTGRICGTDGSRGIIF